MILVTHILLTISLLIEISFQKTTINKRTPNQCLLILVKRAKYSLET